MKALEILKSYQDEIQTSVPSSIDIGEAVEELEALQSKFNRVEVISSSGRVFCDKCDSGRHYELSIQDDNRTLKIFEVKDKQ